MTATSPRKIVVTFQDKFPKHLVDGMLTTNFVGLAETYRGDDPQVLFVFPIPDRFEALKATLDELQAGGALTYVEEHS
jgi:hypothetical protein